VRWLKVLCGYVFPVLLDKDRALTNAFVFVRKNELVLNELVALNITANRRVSCVSLTNKLLLKVIQLKEIFRI